MDNKFSFSRFGQFANAEFKANYRNYLMVMLTVGIVSTAGYLLGVIFNNLNIYVALQFSLAVAIIGTLFNISRSFKKYFNRRTNAEVIMMPIAGSEKFTYIYFCNVIAIPVILYSIVCLIAALSCFISGVDFYAGRFNESIDITILSHIALFSVFFLGSVLFRKHQFILTCLGIGAIMILFSILIGLTRHWIMWQSISDFMGTYFKDKDQTTLITVLSNISRLFTLATIFISVLFAWKKFKKIQTA